MGLIAILITWIPPSFLPENLIASMPGRLLNFAPFGFMAILIGLLAAQGKNIWAHICLTALIIAPLLWYVVIQTTDATAPAMLLGAIATLIIIWKSKNTETQSIIKQRLMSALQLTTTGVLIWLLARGLTHSRLLPIMIIVAIAVLIIIWKSRKFFIRDFSSLKYLWG